MPPQDKPEERQPTLARRSPFAPATKLCPRCLSPLKTVLGLPGMTPPRYECEKCGYGGVVFIEREQQPEKGKS